MPYWGGGGYISAAGLDPATIAWIAAVVANGGTVSTNEAGFVDTLIVGAKADGWFTKLDALWLYAQNSDSLNQPSALTDIIGLILATNVNSTSFGIGGFTGNGSNMQINCNFDPTTASSPHFTATSCCLFGWDNTITPTGSSGCIIGQNGGGQNRLDPSVGGGFFTCNVVGSANMSGTRQTSPYNGLYVCNRPSSSSQVLDFNGSQIASGNSNQTLNNGNFTAFNTGGGFGADQISCVGFGGGLTVGDRTAIYSRLRTYMTSVGVS